MAELFGYTPTQQLVDPSSPTIQVQANLQAADAFKSLSSLMDTALQAKTQQVQNTRMIQNEVDQLKARIASKERAEVAAQKAAKAQAKEEAKLQEDRDFVAFNEAFTAMDGDYENAYAAAGSDIDKQYEATAAYQLELKSRYANLSEGMQTRVSNAVQGKLRTIQERIAKATQESNVASFYENIHTNMPLVMQMTDEQETAYYNDLQLQAKTLGIPLKEMGEKYVKAQKALLMSNVAKYEQAIIQNYDTTSIDQALAVVDRLDKIDGRNSEVIESAREELMGIRKQISDNAVSALKQFAQDGDRDNFDVQFAIVQDIDMVDTPELINLQQDFVNTYFSEKNVAERNVAAIIKRGGTQSSYGMPTKEKNLYNSWITEQLESQIATGNIDREFFRQHANNNPKVFAEAYKSGFTIGIGEVRNLAQKLSATKDEQAQTQIRGEIFQKLRQLNTLKNYGYGVTASDELLQATVMETLVTSGAIANIPEALDNLNDLRGIELISKSDKNVRELRDEVPDSFDEAHELYSALIKMKVPAGEALKAVTQRFSFNSVDGMEAEISGAVMERLQSAGIGPDTLENFEPYLVDLLREDYPEVADELQNVLNGTNPKAVIDGNDIKYYNEEGSVRRIPLTGKALKDAVDSMTERYTKENPTDGFGRIGVEIGRVLQDSIYSKAKTMMEAVTPAAEIAKGAGVNAILVSRSVGEMSVSVAENVDTWVDNVLFQNMSAAEANKLLFSALNKDASAVAKYNKDINKLIEADFQEALEKANAALASDDLPTVENGVKQLVETMFNGFFPKAEGSVEVSSGYYVQGVSESYLSQLAFVESTNNPNAKAKTSSATGLYQFIDKTWKDTVNKYEPSLKEGRTEEELLALRTDPEISKRMVAYLTKENSDALIKAGVYPSDDALYLAHFAGASKAKKLYQADTLEDAEKVLGENVIKANPFLKGMKVIDVIAWARKKMGML